MAGHISVDADVLGGTPCFTGTRVPVRNLFDYLEDGSSIDEFLEAFPSVSRGQVIGILADAAHRIVESVH